MAEWIGVACGVVAYLAFVVVIAAGSSTMGLRFLSVAFVVASVTTVTLLDASEGVIVLMVTVLFVGVGPLTPLKTLGCEWAAKHTWQGWKTSTILDMRAQACQSGSALADFQRNVILPNHPWLRMGVAFRQSEE